MFIRKWLCNVKIYHFRLLLLLFYKKAFTSQINIRAYVLQLMSYMPFYL